MGDGVVTNNLKKTQDTGQLDSSRAYGNIYSLFKFQLNIPS